MRKMKWKLAALVTTGIILFTGCGTSVSKAIDVDVSEKAAYEAAYDVGTAEFDGESSYAANMSDTDAESDDAEPRLDEAVETVEAVEAVETAGTDVEANDSDEDKNDEKLVYTCDMRMQTLTYDETLANIRKEISKVDGIIESENETDSGSDWYYDGYSKSRGEKTIYLTVRVPSKNYKGFLKSLEGEGKIMSKNSYVENITRRYHDTEAVIRNLEMQEERLQAMMEQAQTIEDMITIEKRLTEVQTELDQNRTYLSSMDTDVAFSTVNLTIEEVVRYSSDPPKTLTFADRLYNTLSDSWHNFLFFLETVLFAVILIAPIAVTILIVVFIVIGINKAWRKKHPKRKRQETSKKQKTVIDEESKQD